MHGYQNVFLVPLLHYLLIIFLSVIVHGKEVCESCSHWDVVQNVIQWNWNTGPDVPTGFVIMKSQLVLHPLVEGCAWCDTVPGRPVSGQQHGGVGIITYQSDSRVCASRRCLLNIQSYNYLDNQQYIVSRILVIRTWSSGPNPNDPKT